MPHYVRAYKNKEIQKDGNTIYGKIPTQTIRRPGNVFPDWDIVAVENLSAGGMLFNYSKNLERDSLLDLKIDISKSTHTINCVGKIIRIEEFQHLLTQDVKPLNSMLCSKKICI